MLSQTLVRKCNKRVIHPTGPSAPRGNQETVVTQLQRSVSDVVRELEANKKRDNREGRRQLYHHPRWNGLRPDPRGKREDDSLPSTSRDTRREEHEGDLPGNAHSPITLCNDGGRGIPPMSKRQRPWQRKMQVNNCSSLVRIFFLRSYSFLRGLRSETNSGSILCRSPLPELDTCACLWYAQHTCPFGHFWTLDEEVHALSRLADVWPGRVEPIGSKHQSLSKFAEPEVDGFLDVLNTPDG